MGSKRILSKKMFSLNEPILSWKPNFDSPYKNPSNKKETLLETIFMTFISYDILFTWTGCNDRPL